MEILVLNRGAEVYTRYSDIMSAFGFLSRVGRWQAFSIVAHKGKKALFLEKLDPATVVKELTEFQNTN